MAAATWGARCWMACGCATPRRTRATWRRGGSRQRIRSGGAAARATARGPAATARPRGSTKSAWALARARHTRGPTTGGAGPAGGAGGAGAAGAAGGPAPRRERAGHEGLAAHPWHHPHSHGSPRGDSGLRPWTDQTRSGGGRGGMPAAPPPPPPLALAGVAPYASFLERLGREEGGAAVPSIASPPGVPGGTAGGYVMATAQGGAAGQAMQGGAGGGADAPPNLQVPPGIPPRGLRYLGKQPAGTPGTPTSRDREAPGSSGAGGPASMDVSHGDIGGGGGGSHGIGTDGGGGSGGGGNGGRGGGGGGGSWDTSGRWNYESPHAGVAHRASSDGEAMERSQQGQHRGAYGGYRGVGVRERGLAEARMGEHGVGRGSPGGHYLPARAHAASAGSADALSQLTSTSGRSDNHSAPAGVGVISPAELAGRGPGGMASPPHPVWSNPEPSSVPLVALGDNAAGASTDGTGHRRSFNVEDSRSRPCGGEEGDGSEQATRGGASGVAKDAEYLRALGFQLCRAGRFEEAVVQYEHSIASLPFTRMYPVLGDKSAALLVLGRWREALADAEAATTWALKAHHLYEVEKGLYLQGQALLCLQRPHKAVLAFQQCLALRPSNVTGQRALMEALQAAEVEEARARVEADAEGDRVVVQSTGAAALGADPHLHASADNGLLNKGNNNSSYGRASKGEYGQGEGGAGGPYVGVPRAFGDASALPPTVLAAAHTVAAGQRLFEEEPILLVPSYPTRAWLARNPKYKKVREICRRCQLDEILARAVMEYQDLPEAAQHKVRQLGSPAPPPPGIAGRSNVGGNGGSGSAGRRPGLKIWSGDLVPELAALLEMEPALLEKLLTIFHCQSAMTEDGAYMAVHELYPSLLHSCAPNCQAFCGRLDAGTATTTSAHEGSPSVRYPPAGLSPGGMRVVALTTIPRGAVLTVSYLADDDLLACTERRQLRLMETRGAPCSCMRCLRPDKARVFICQACCSPSVLAPPPLLSDLWRGEASAHASMSGNAAVTNGDSSRAGASGGQPGSTPSPAGAPGVAAAGGVAVTGDGSVPCTPLRSECDSAGTSGAEGQPFVCLKCNKHVESATVSLMLQQERELRQHIENLERRRFMPFAQPVLTLLSLAERTLVAEQHALVATLHEMAYERASDEGDLATAGRHLFKCIEYAKAVHPGILMKTAQYKEALGDILASQLVAEPEPQRHETRLLAAQLFQSACADLCILRGKAHADYQKASRKLFDLLLCKPPPSGSEAAADDQLPRADILTKSF
eukprot:jgi/Mesvir1/4790/Mv11090-RA.3